MKIKSLNKKFIFVLTLVLTLSLSMVLGIVLIKNDAQAEPVTVTAEGNFWLKDGASVRMGNNGNGLRYTFQITEEAYNSYKQSYGENLKFGVLIAPKSYTLNKTTVFGVGGESIYGWAEKNPDGTWAEYKGSKTQIANLETSALKDATETVAGGSVDVKEFYGSLTKIKTANIAAEFRGVGYVGFSTDGVNYDYVFVTSDSNIRSMAYVAQLAMEDTSDEALDGTEKQQIKTEYLDKVASAQSSFTVEYYVKQANGEFVLDSSKTQNVDSTIGAVPQYTDPIIDGYEFDSDNPLNEIGTTVYANDKLVIKKYYIPKEYTISYNLGTLASDQFVSACPTSHSVAYGSSFELATVSCEGYVFLGWKDAQGNMVDGATFDYTEDLSLTAVWFKDEAADRWGPWSPII